MEHGVHPKLISHSSSTRSLLFPDVDLVHGSCTPPDTAEVLLAHCKASNSKVICDVVDDQRAEACIRQHGDSKSEEDNHSRIMYVMLNQGRTKNKNM